MVVRLSEKLGRQPFANSFIHLLPHLDVYNDCSSGAAESLLLSNSERMRLRLSCHLLWASGARRTRSSRRCGASRRAARRSSAAWAWGWERTRGAGWAGAVSGADVRRRRSWCGRRPRHTCVRCSCSWTRARAATRGARCSRSSSGSLTRARCSISAETRPRKRMHPLLTPADYGFLEICDCCENHWFVKIETLLLSSVLSLNICEKLCNCVYQSRPSVWNW